MAEGPSSDVQVQSPMTEGNACNPTYKYVVKDVKFERGGSSENSTGREEFFYHDRIILTTEKVLREPDSPRYDCVICHPPEDAREFARGASFACRQAATRCSFMIYDTLDAIEAGKKSMNKALRFAGYMKSNKAAEVYRAIARLYDSDVQVAQSKLEELRVVKESAKSAADAAQAAADKLGVLFPITPERISAVRSAGDEAIEASKLACNTELVTLAALQKCWRYLDPTTVIALPMEARKEQRIISFVKNASLILGSFIACVVLSKVAVRKIHIPLISLKSAFLAIPMFYLPYYLPYQAYIRHKNELRVDEEEDLREAEEKEEALNTISGYNLHLAILTNNLNVHNKTPPPSESDVEQEHPQENTDS